MALLQNFYETTLEALREAKNDRLWFKTNTKLGKLYFDREDYGKLQRILKQLHQSCQVCRIDIAVVVTLLLLIQTTCHHCWLNKGAFILTVTETNKKGLYRIMWK